MEFGKLLNLSELEVGKSYEILRVSQVHGPNDWRNLEFSIQGGVYLNKIIKDDEYTPEVDVIFANLTHKHIFGRDKYRLIPTLDGKKVSII